MQTSPGLWRRRASGAIISGVTTAALLVSATVGCDQRSATAAKKRPAAPQAAAARTVQAAPTAAAAPESLADAATAEVAEVAAAAPAEAATIAAAPVEAASTDPAPPATGAELYAMYCAACHGATGDGKGLAAPYLFPKPRDFRAGNFRLVSTSNNVPTREDLQAVLMRGMPGSTMPPWNHLPPGDRDALVDEVLRMRREGARDAYIATLRDAEQLTDEEIAAPEVQEEIEQYVEDFTTPGDSSEAPEIDDPTAESVARGKGVYATFGCISCHGAEGKGDGVQEMFDVETMPTRPRDFTLGIFKGNPDPASLYRRIAYGMPGTPMPGSSTMTPEQRVDLVHFIRSMSTEEQRQAATLSRQRIVAARVPKIDDPEDDSLWAQAPAARMQVMPLWWRTAPDPELTVQAIHDGETLSVRLSWLDATEEAHALASETFKDAAAMQLYRGAREPFLGMGVAATPVDVWFWDADHQGPPAAVEDVHPRMVVDQYPFSESAVASAEFSRDAARTANQPDVSLPAKAAGNRVTPVGDSPGASSLSGGGPGTVTFRPPMSQIVTAHGVWADGRWTVVMKRPLAPAADEGLVVHPGEAASVAFAVWDGAQRDRDGQKLITIWQDLELAK